MSPINHAANAMERKERNLQESGEDFSMRPEHCVPLRSCVPKVLAAERWVRVVHVHVDSPTAEAERTVVIRVPACPPGAVAFARITWKPEPPGPDDAAAHRVLKSQLKRIGSELRCTVRADSEAVAAKPAASPELGWCAPSATDETIDAPGLSYEGAEACNPGAYRPICHRNEKRNPP